VSEEEAEEEYDVKKWTEGHWTQDFDLFAMRPFDQPTGIAIDMPGDAGARTFFDLFFTDDVLEMIVRSML
jgi:hypothetical protein